MGSRRCRRPIAGFCDWGAGELVVGVVPYWMSLSSYEATMSLSEQFLWSAWGSDRGKTEKSEKAVGA